jgi:dTDP-4-dehydrorhamnose 3,5-epimerase
VKFTPLELPEVILVKPDVHRDERGFFLESWHREKYARGGIDVDFVQDNHSRSGQATLRGLHAQLAPRAQGKLVRVVAGEIWDVALDIREGSPRFGRWTATRLSGENLHQLWIPPGFAHGFCVTSELADVEYKCSEPYDPACEIAVAWDDPTLAIPWPVARPRLSPRDRVAPRLAGWAGRLPRYEAASIAGGER